jgi:3-methyladenine DNA glycosylase AlkD
MASTTAAVLLRELEARADPVHARNLQRFFRTGPGEYGAGDLFLGIRMPALRSLARQTSLSVAEACTLLRSPLHEARMLALLLLVRLYDRGDARQRAEVYEAYLNERAHINNWDLVDTSAPHIVGKHLFGAGAGQESSASSTDMLNRLAASPSLWDRRMAILSTQYFIRQGHFSVTLRLAELLLHDRHDLIHKAVGWMLREVGNRNREVEESFLRAHAHEMPRTMLRYAVEKFPAELRAVYMGR